MRVNIGVLAGLALGTGTAYPVTLLSVLGVAVAALVVLYDAQATATLVVLPVAPVATSPNVTFQTNAPANAVDGNVATWWQPIAGTVNPSIFVDRGPGAPDFTAVRLQWYPDPTYAGIDYTIAVSDDNSTWTTIATVTGNTQTDRSHAALTWGRYVRLIVTARTPDTDPNFAQLALLELTTPTGALASSTDTTWVGNVPANVLDGDINTFWQPVAATVTPTLVVDRGPGAPAFRSVRYQWYGLGYQGIDYTTQTSDDNSTWTTIATVTGNLLADLTSTFAWTTARFVRVVVTALNPTPDPWAHVALKEFTLPDTAGDIAASGSMSGVATADSTLAKL